MKYPTFMVRVLSRRWRVVFIFICAPYDVMMTTTRIMHRCVFVKNASGVCSFVKYATNTRSVYYSIM